MLDKLGNSTQAAIRVLIMSHQWVVMDDSWAESEVVGVKEKERKAWPFFKEVMPVNFLWLRGTVEISLYVNSFNLLSLRLYYVVIMHMQKSVDNLIMHYIQLCTFSYALDP